MTRKLTASALWLLASCSSALGPPSPIAAYAPGHANGRSADQLVAEGNAAWAKRASPGQAEAAQGLYLDAAVAANQRVDGLLGAMRTLAFRIEFEPGVAKGTLAGEAVELGQWCQRRRPSEAECDYRLAIALGQQARERPSTGKDALNRMVDLLHRTIAAAPTLDSAGPHRVLALVLLRAPSWPIGPGDSETALQEARAAARLVPDNAENQLVLGEALAANGKADEAREAYRKAAALATAAGHAGAPEAARWQAQAKSGIDKAGG
jgi:tetratricopeptide (TPR) repeat protein